MVQDCIERSLDTALQAMQELFGQGYSALDIITTLNRVIKSHDMIEYLRLQFIKVLTTTSAVAAATTTIDCYTFKARSATGASHRVMLCS
jgi:hypothetical protein